MPFSLVDLIRARQAQGMPTPQGSPVVQQVAPVAQQTAPVVAPQQAAPVSQQTPPQQVALQPLNNPRTGQQVPQGDGLAQMIAEWRQKTAQSLSQAPQRTASGMFMPVSMGQAPAAQLPRQWQSLPSIFGNVQALQGGTQRPMVPGSGGWRPNGQLDLSPVGDLSNVSGPTLQAINQQRLMQNLGNIGRK